MYDLSALAQFEKKANSINFKVNDIPAWGLVRFLFLPKWWAQKTEKLPRKERVSRKSKKVGLYFGWRNLFSSYQYLFFSSSQSRVKFNGVYFDRFCDPLIDYLGKDDCLLFERISLKYDSAQSPFTKKVVSSSWITILRMAVSWVPGPSTAGAPELAELARDHGISLDISRNIRLLYLEYLAFRILFKLYNPETIFFVQKGMSPAIVWAAKISKIRVVEIGHGIIYPEHGYYNSTVKIDQSFIPDFYLAISKRSIDCLANSSVYKPETVFEIGATYLEKLKGKDFFLPHTFSDYEKTFCVSLQVSNESLLLPFVKEIAIRHRDWGFILAVRNKSLDYSNFSFPSNILLSSEIPGENNVYELIRMTNFHITISSTCSIEAPLLERKTLLFSPMGQESIIQKYFYDSNWMQVVRTVREFEETIQYWTECPVSERQTVISEGCNKVFEKIPFLKRSTLS